jgi:nucleoside-diphosphate-sugar epimerase
MKVLIAGATGVVGRPLVRMLGRGGHEVFALTRSPPRSRRDTGRRRRHGPCGLLAAADGQAPFGEPGGPFPRTVAAMRSAEEQIFGAAGVEGVSLRYGGFYGPGAVDGMIEALRRRRLPVARGGVAPWTYVEDAASATVAALEHGRAGQAYNVCDDEAATWLDVVAELARVFGAPRPMRARVARPARGPVRRRADDVHVAAAVHRQGQG